MPKLHLALLALLALSAGCPLGPGNDDPETRSCNGAASPALDGFTIYNASYENEVFDGGVLNIAHGGQGSDMAVLEYLFADTDAPDCIDHSTRLSACTGDDCGSIDYLIAESNVALPVQPDSTGWHTGILYLIVDGPQPALGSRVQLEVTLGATTQTFEVLWDANLEEPASL